MKGMLTTAEEIQRVAEVLDNYDVDSKRIIKDMKKEGATPVAILRGLVGTLYDGLAYGNWPAASTSEEKKP